MSVFVLFMDANRHFQQLFYYFKQQKPSSIIHRSFGLVQGCLPSSLTIILLFFVTSAIFNNSYDLSIQIRDAYRHFQSIVQLFLATTAIFNSTYYFSALFMSTYRHFRQVFSYFGNLCCLTPLSTIFQLYQGGQFYWWRKQEYLVKICCISLTNYHIMLVHSP